MNDTWRQVDWDVLHPAAMEAPSLERCLTLANQLSQRLVGPCNVELVRATAKSQVFKVQGPTGAFALKLHAQAEAYAKEAACYALLDEHGITPRLAWHNTRLQALLIDWVDGAPPICATAAAYWLGVLHGSLQRALRDLPAAQLVRSHHLLAAQPWSRFARLLTAGWGPEHTCFAVGDVKPEHLLLKAAAGYWVDFETLTHGSVQCADIVRLVHTTVDSPLSREAGLAVCSQYLRGYRRYLPVDSTAEELQILVEVLRHELWPSARVNLWRAA
jgi:hypothetical protein